MGEFHDAVATLLQAFASGISIIKAQRVRRKHEKGAGSSDRKSIERTLSRSLKRNRKEVKEAYERDVRALGTGFSAGDDEARSRLATILLRLNTGFMSIIERLVRGKTSADDYHSLISLSNTSRVEAMRTFEQLSQRVRSQSSLALVPADTTHTRKRKRKSSKKGSSKSSKSTATLANTPLGYANTAGWVRRKPGVRNVRHSYIRTSEYPNPQKVPGNYPLRILNTLPPAPLAPGSSLSSRTPPISPPFALQFQVLSDTSSSEPVPSRRFNRRSIMSFVSDSTKLGEIPVHKWMRPSMFQDIDEKGEVKFPVTAFYPIEPYVEPVKKSRLKRLFGIL